MRAVEVRSPRAKVKKIEAIYDGVSHAEGKVRPSEKCEAQATVVVDLKQEWRSKGQVHALERNGTYTQSRIDGTLIVHSDLWKDMQKRLNALGSKLDRVDILARDGEILAQFEKIDGEWVKKP